MVRADDLEPDTIVRAIQAGDFYASTGVEIQDIGLDQTTFTVDIATRPGITYETEFIGAVRGKDGTRPTSTILARTNDDPAIYRFTGDELYVRAKVTSSRPHPRPYREGDMETAWTQPVPGSRPSDDPSGAGKP